jgi:hypothetical protein
VTPFAITVQCHAGYRGEETPRRFFLHNRQIEVVEVIDRWLAPDHRYFKVRDSDGGVSIIRHDVFGDRWELTMYASSPSGPPHQAGNA